MISSASFPDPDCTRSWWVMNTVRTLVECKPYLLSLISRSQFLFFNCFDSQKCSRWMAHHILGNWSNIFQTKNWPWFGYLTLYPLMKMNVTVGNSFLRRAFVASFPAIVISYPFSKRCSIIGMQRVACPSPQSNGAIKIEFFFFIIRWGLVVFSKSVHKFFKN